MLLSRKTAVVTGGASGIGAAIAERLAEEGANVILADIDDTSGKAHASTITERGEKASFIHCDCGDLGWIARMTSRPWSLRDKWIS